MNDFWLGYTVMLCWNQMTQAWMGKDQYLKAVDLLWMNDPWYFWAALMLLVWISNLFRKKNWI